MALCQEKVNKSLKSYNRSGLSGIHKCAHQILDSQLESEEETYFPALCVGLDKPSAVIFCMDNQTKVQTSTEFEALDDTSVPLYDRGYSLALTSGDASSSLDGYCPKPRNTSC
ncbi:hypothetical protein CASFOL_011286 [Castilleja foliolosa]|uniref:Uncharacterized protein n=2 Tax=Castilleja foliolosa TaxID=1961234 RepID=A0ABD3DZ52_9LAMI